MHSGILPFSIPSPQVECGSAGQGCRGSTPRGVPKGWGQVTLSPSLSLVFPELPLGVLRRPAPGAVLSPPAKTPLRSAARSLKWRCQSLAPGLTTFQNRPSGPAGQHPRGARAGPAASSLSRPALGIPSWWHVATQGTAVSTSALRLRQVEAALASPSLGPWLVGYWPSRSWTRTLSLCQGSHVTVEHFLECCQAREQG